MSDTALSLESNYRNTPLAAVGLLLILAAGAGAGWAAVTFLPAPELLLPAVEIAGATIVSIVLLLLATQWRHRWTADAQSVRIVETHKYFRFWPHRDVVVPFNQITALRHIETGFDVMLELETASGARHFLMPAVRANVSGIVLPDPDGLHAFANALRVRVAAAGVTDATFHDGLGFWNKSAGLALLGIGLVFTTGLSGLILYGVLSGADMPQGAAMQGLGLVAVLPIGVAYALYRSWARRSFVLGLGALRTQTRAKRL